MLKNFTLQYCDKNGTVVSSESVGQSLHKLTLLEVRSNDKARSGNLLDRLVDLSAFEGEFFWAHRQATSLDMWDVLVSRQGLAEFLSTLVEPSRLDYLCWSEVKLPPQLLVFDMDSTFIEIEVIDELARRHGVGEQVASVTEAAMQGELDFAESLVSRVACLKGLSDSAISEICEILPLSKGVEELVERCHANHIKIAIVSGGFTPFVGHLKQTMNLFSVHANELETSEGQLTGKVVGGIVDAKAKADFVKELAASLNIAADQVMTIGDGANDLVMMKESGFSLAYRAKPRVQKEALGRMNLTSLNHLADVFGW